MLDFEKLKTEIESPQMHPREVDSLAAAWQVGVKVCAFGVISKDNRRAQFLFLRRSMKEELFPGKWGLPGGSFEKQKDENPEATALRETFEETSLKTKIRQELGLSHELFFIKGRPWIFRGHFYELEVPASSGLEIRLNEEHTAWTFAAPESASAHLALAGKTLVFIQKSLSRNDLRNTKY